MEYGGSQLDRKKCHGFIDSRRIQEKQHNRLLTFNSLHDKNMSREDVISVLKQVYQRPFPTNGLKGVHVS